jgi:dipeptidyl aminopeptidase/acylaminoacyl peptidase
MRAASRSLLARRALVCVLAAGPLLAAPDRPAAADPTGGGSGGTHPFTVHDLVAMDRIGEPAVAPDGGRVAFVVRSTDLAANRGRKDLWLVELGPTGASAPRRLTTHEADDSGPRWSPDGAWIYFLSKRSGSSQAWRLPANGGEAEPVTRLPLDVENLVVSPDGSRLAFTAEVFPDCASLRCTADRLAERAKDPATGRLYDRLFIRHWDTWADGRRSHLFTLPLAAAGTSDGGAGTAEPTDLTRGLDADVPSKPFGDAAEFAFSPDGASVAFTARAAGREEAWSTDFDLYLAPADGSRPPVELTAGNPAWDTHPVFSPDGGTLAYLAMARPGYEADRFRIVLKPLPDGEPRVLTEGWDRSPDSLLFSADGATLYATAADLGQTALFAVDVASGAVRKLAGEGTVRWPRLAAGGGGGGGGERIVFGRESLLGPAELFAVEAGGGEPVRLTDVNRPRLAAVRLGEPEQFQFAGWGGETVYGYVVKPVDFDPGKRYPIAFLIHGGPQGSFGNDFHYRWNPQTYAGAGYAAVMVDFHGSTGYGQAFTDAIRGDWGGKPLEDLQQGLAAALARFPWLDGERACALGASYGGYMVNWIAGAWPDGFRCLVNHDGLFDHRTMYYTTEELWFPEWEHLGSYFENPEAHERHNPAHHVARWRTPMLVVHGALDYRVPDGQGLATFTALQRRGIPSELLYFPDENHWVLKPANSILWHDTVLGWLDRWLKR